MIKLGLSLYPEQETLEDIEQYLKTASQYGFSTVFVSLFSVPGTKEEVMAHFIRFGAIAHKYGFEISGDCNGEFLTKMGASPEDLSVFKEMGIDIIRMDGAYNDERDARLINNKEGIKVEMSTAFQAPIELALKNGADPKRMLTCHNFYPERYTAPSLEAINELNEYWKAKGIPVTIFISSQEKGTHGPWPVSDGLPTVEEHRNIPVEAQLKHMIALKNVSEVRLGNAYASEEEFKAMKQVMDLAYIHVDLPEGIPAFVAGLLPHGDLVRIPFKLHLERDVTDLEQELVFDYQTHADMGDCLNYMLRSRFTRMLPKSKGVAPRPCSRKVFRRGDVLIVNQNCLHYAGEVQIVLKDMENDGQRNLVGTIDPTEIMILNHMGAGDLFTFVEI